MLLRISLLLGATVTTLTLAGNAFAGGGNYVFSGGTAAEQTSVRAALDASAFDWSIVPAQITIQIGRDRPTASWRGTISLDSDLVDAGKLAWGTILHEYAHQVDFFLLDDPERSVLQSALGGRSWWFAPGLAHSDLASERFASTLAWAYWPTAANLMDPSDCDDTSTIAPESFRALLARLIGAPDQPSNVMNASVPKSEISADNRHVEPVVDAWRGGKAANGQPDLAPAPIEEIATMPWALHPHLYRAGWRQRT